MSVAADVSDWIATPAPLNRNKCGRRAVFSSDNSVVQRGDPESWRRDCVCYTVHPLPPGQVWQTTVLETTTKWSFGLVVGVTATLPDVVPPLLPSNQSGPHKWNYEGSSLYHNGRELSSGLPNLDNLKPQQRVGLLLTASGDLHVFIDRRHVKKVASGLPVNDHLWGAVDVCGKCTKIKSELLSDPTAAILREAMKDGYIPHKDDLFLIHGPGGVGKSSLISMFLGKQRDLARVSTAESLHLCPVRDVSTSTFTDQWELVDIDRQASMVAHTSRHLLTGKRPATETVQETQVIRSAPSLQESDGGKMEAGKEGESEGPAPAMAFPPAEGPEKKAKPRRQKKATAAPPISISAEKPNLPQLLEIDLPSRVAPKINAFGTFLLQDDLGNKMEIIRGNHQGRLEEMTMQVLREWLTGKGVEVSWESLIATLRKSKLKLMADQIQIALDQLRS